ncbi:MAG: minor capsid protein [Eggerthellaceae bacterium]|nr:minor capsid protein [Eggerthellaceae bacterium]
MFGVVPIPLWMLGDSMFVSVPDGYGGFREPVEVSPVRFEEEQSASDDAHRSADAGGGTVFVDAANSRGAFEIPVGSRVEIGGVSYVVRTCQRRGEFGSKVHHWELVVS